MTTYAILNFLSMQSTNILRFIGRCHSWLKVLKKNFCIFSNRGPDPDCSDPICNPNCLHAGYLHTKFHCHHPWLKLLSRNHFSIIRNSDHDLVPSDPICNCKHCLHASYHKYQVSLKLLLLAHRVFLLLSYNNISQLQKQ